MPRKGFTLIETMIVLAVVAVFFGISAPHFSRFISGIRLKSGASDISNTLRSARSYARSRHMTHFVNFDLEKEEFWIEGEGEGAVLGRIFKVPHGIDITQTDFANNEIEFRASGRASQSGSVWIANNQGRIRRIAVSELTGSVTVDQLLPE